MASCASKPEQRKEFPYVAANQEVKAPADMGLSPHLNESEEAKDPVMQPGFLIDINNLEDRKLNGSFRVDFEGVLKLPYNVVLDTTGLKFSDLKTQILNSYRRFFQTQSAFGVNLTKKEYWIEVRGLVDKPGRLLVEPHSSIESIVSKAGGLKKELEPRYLKFVRRDKSEFALSLTDYFKSGSNLSFFSVSGGDTLFFQVDQPTGKNLVTISVDRVQIMGEVLKAGDYTHQPEKDIYYYLTLAGGPAPGADLSSVKIVRGPPNNRVITSLDTLEEGQRPLILPGDLIIVPHDKPTKFERNVSLSSSLATVLSAILLIFVVL